MVCVCACVCAVLGVCCDITWIACAWVHDGMANECMGLSHVFGNGEVKDK